VQKLSYQKNTCSTAALQHCSTAVTFAPKLTPREKIGFEVINISIKKTLHVSSKQNGARF